MSLQTFLQYIKESDARSDSTLVKYSVQTQSLSRLASTTDPAFLAVGLKGIGKSASFRLLTELDNNKLIQKISAKTQYNLDISGSRPTLQYVETLKGELIVQILIGMLTTHKDHELLKSVPQDLMQEAKILVEDIWGKVKTVLGRLGSVSILGFGVGFRPSDKKDMHSRFIERNQYDKALSLVSKLSKILHMRIVVDDPESIFTADEHLNDNMVAALVIAAYELHKELHNFKCIILIKPNVMRALRRVDEFANIPLSSRVRLTWSEDELKLLVRKRAEAANIGLKDVFLSEPEAALEAIIRDSRTGPRDVLRRLELHFDTFPDEPVTEAALERTIGAYSDACLDQIVAAYDRQYPGLSRAALILFEGKSQTISKLEMDARLDQMIASNTEILAFKDQPWARDAVHLTDLLLQFGLVAIKREKLLHLPFHETYLEEGSQQEAVLTFLPALRGRVRKRPISPGPVRPRSRRT